jgi:hypothetical protein
MRNTRWHGQQHFGATAAALLLITCAVVILACSGTSGDLVEATPTATGAAGATAVATSSAVASTPTAVPPKPTSTPKPKPPTATPVPFRITSASVSVSPAHYTGGCVDVTMTFTYTFKLLAHGPGGTISFYTYGPDGPPSGTMTVTVKSGQTTVTSTQQVDYDQGTIFADESPWIQTQATKPNKVTSNKANYIFTCIS